MTEQVRSNNTQTTFIPRVNKTKRPYDPTNNRERGYKFLWAVYPDYWPQKWGQRPTLGHVRADSKEDAVYAAYDRGLSHPSNCTFGLELVKLDPIERKPTGFNASINNKKRYQK